METYSVTVNGVTYEVQVEKKNSTGVSVPAPGAIAPSAPQEVKKPAPTSVEGEKITAGAAGKVWKIVVAEGQAVKSGDTIVILEAMKMEIPVVAPKSGVIGQIVISEGSSVEAGDLLATIN
jgi:biotin carboxyl carrier protein